MSCHNSRNGLTHKPQQNTEIIRLNRSQIKYSTNENTSQYKICRIQQRSPGSRSPKFYDMPRNGTKMSVEQGYCKTTAARSPVGGTSFNVRILPKVRPNPQVYDFPTQKPSHPCTPEQVVSPKVSQSSIQQNFQRSIKVYQQRLLRPRVSPSKNQSRENSARYIAPVSSPH